MLMDSHNSEMFSGIFGSVVDERSDEMNSGEGNDAAHALANSSFMVSPHFII